MLAVNETSLTLQVEYYRQDDLQLPLDAVIVSFCREQCQDRRPMVRAIILNIQSVMISLHLISVETGVISIRKSQRFLGFCLRSLHKNHCLVGALHQIVHSGSAHHHNNLEQNLWGISLFENAQSENDLCPQHKNASSKFN
mgnify:CR=1 FL=1